MPVFLIGAPLAAIIAWYVLRANGGRPLVPGRGGGDHGAPSGMTDQAMTQGQPEMPFEWNELPFTNGNEVGGPYGPASNVGGDGSSSPGDGPAPTQTTITDGGVVTPIPLVSPGRSGKTPVGPPPIESPGRKDSVPVPPASPGRRPSASPSIPSPGRGGQTGSGGTRGTSFGGSANLRPGGKLS